MSTPLVAYVPDLIDRSKVAAAAPGARFAARPEQLAEPAWAGELVVVDLGRPGVLEVLPRVPGRVIGFGSHVDRELLETARGAGCDQVLARSAFFSRLPELLASAR